jgi:hypothetical protein
VTDGTLNATAPYRLFLGTPVADGTGFLVAQPRLVQGQLVLVAIGFGQGDAQGFIVFDCASPKFIARIGGGVSDKSRRSVWRGYTVGSGERRAPRRGWCTARTRREGETAMRNGARRLSCAAQAEGSLRG